MKIVMIGQKGIPTLFGGIERHVEEVSCRLAKKKNCQVFVYARSYYTPRKNRKYKKVNIIHLPSIRTKHLDAISHVFLSTLHAIFIVRPNIIHYHGIGPSLCLWMPKVLSPWRKVVFTFHCRDYFHKKWGWAARFFLKLGEKIGCHLADEVISVSPELQEYVQRKYHRQTELIAHGINREKYVYPKQIKKWGLEKNNYLLTVVRLIPHKGIHHLIKAYRNIETDKKLVIVGPAFYTNNYENQLKKITKNHPNIIFLGAQKGKVLRELYSNAELFIHPSEQEGMPLVVLEAASFGCPLLLSDIPAHQSILKNLPFFFRNKNTSSLKQRLEFILRNPEFVHYQGRRIKKYSRKKYSWDESVERIVLKYA